MNKKIYVCNANECTCNRQGTCSNDFGITIAVYDGMAICPNYTPMDVKKMELIEGMYQVLVRLLLEDHGDEMDEDIRDYELHTNTDGTVYMTPDGADYLTSICVNNDKVVAIVDAINVLKYGRVLKVTEAE